MKVQVAIPCYNEEIAIAKVVQDFKASIPEAEVVVYDNNSSDNTGSVAREAGARVVLVNRRGKGYVVQEIFETCPADIIVLVDGDDTYEAGDVRALIQPLKEKAADMTIGTRLHMKKTGFRKMHFFGNKLITGILNVMFKTHNSDVLSGYRAFTRQFIERIPLISAGFQVEVELIIQALENGIVVKEVPIGFRDRPKGSFSKLSSFKDGYSIIMMMVVLLRDHKPLFVFSLIGLFVLCIGVSFWIIGFLYAAQKAELVILRNAGVVMMAFATGLFMVGLILNTINIRFKETVSLLRRKKL